MVRKITKRKIPVFKVTIPPGISYSVLTDSPDVIEVVMDETVIAIKEGITKNKKSITLFEVANSEYYIELKKDQWKSSLETAIEYYVNKEDYNRCIECRDLINKL